MNVHQPGAGHPAVAPPPPTILPTNALAQRPYLQQPKTRQKDPPAPATTGEPKAATKYQIDIGKLLGAPAPVTWGALLAQLPAEVVTKLLGEARGTAGTTAGMDAAVEFAAVEATVAAHLHQRHPQNIFTPFTILHHQPDPGPPSEPTLHWGNVDTGSMVNIVYQGVLTVFPELLQYWAQFYHEVKGVGGIRTAVVGKLVGVPLVLGMPEQAGGSVRTNFYVLDSNEYHWIVGLALLEVIDGAVFCKDRILQYSTSTNIAPATTHTISLQPRSYVQSQPAYTFHLDRINALEAPSANSAQPPTMHA